MPVVDGTSGCTSHHGPAKVKQGIVSMSSAIMDRSKAEVDAERYFWGKDASVASTMIEKRDAHDLTSSKKNQQRARKELEVAPWE